MCLVIDQKLHWIFILLIELGDTTLTVNWVLLVLKEIDEFPSE